MMRFLFQQLTDDETDDSIRRDLIKFLKELCMFSSTLQGPEREHFFQVTRQHPDPDTVDVCGSAMILKCIRSEIPRVSSRDP